jgi:hypothetical protein
MRDLPWTLAIFTGQIIGSLLGVAFAFLTTCEVHNGLWSIDPDHVPTISPHSKESFDFFMTEEREDTIFLMDMQMYFIQIVCSFIYIAVNLALLTKLS